MHQVESNGHPQCGDYINYFNNYRFCDRTAIHTIRKLINTNGTKYYSGDLVEGWNSLILQIACSFQHATLATTANMPDSARGDRLSIWVYQ